MVYFGHSNGVINGVTMSCCAFTGDACYRSRGGKRRGIALGNALLQGCTRFAGNDAEIRHATRSPLNRSRGRLKYGEDNNGDGGTYGGKGGGKRSEDRAPITPT